MSRVFVIDAERRPQDLVHPGTARWLLDRRQTAVFRRFPFTLILERAIPNAQSEHLRVKVDPGSDTTWLALLNDTTGQVMWTRELAFGFQTGDMVRATVPPGRKTSVRNIGRVQVRASGSFDLTTAAKRVQAVSHRYCWVISQSDGYGYTC